MRKLSKNMANGVKKRGRSPAFPFIDLEHALARAQQLKRIIGDGAADPTQAKLCWGYSLVNSGGSQTISALKQFGLVHYRRVGQKRQLKLSALAMRILLERGPTSHIRVESIRTAALTPKIHRDLWYKWKGRLPSEDQITSYLTHERAFNKNGAFSLIRQYKATLAFAGLGLPQPQALIGITESSMEAVVAESVSRHLAPASGAGMRQEIFSLDEGNVLLQFPKALSAGSLEDTRDLASTRAAQGEAISERRHVKVAFRSKLPYG